MESNQTKVTVNYISGRQLIMNGHCYFIYEQITLFADDNYVLVWKKHRGELMHDMSAKLTLTLKWFKDSGLKVNESKKELCLFHRKD